MARKEAVFGMKVDTGNSVNEMKSLDKEFKKLNDQMIQMEKNGDTNSKAFKDLSKAVKESGQKIEKAFEESQKELAKFSGDMEHLGDEILVEVSGSISKMEDRMYELALAGDTTSKEFRELQAQTAKYKKIIIETDRSIDALAEQGRGLSTALSISSGAVAGFQAYTGVTALLGDENEELLATITKLQGAQGVLNSIETIKQQLDAKSIVLTRARTTVQNLLNKAIGSGTKGMKLFRGAILASGIGGVIILVGALIANFDKLKNMLSGTTKAQKTMNDVTDKAIDSIAKELSASDKLQKQLADETLTRKEKVKAVKKLQTEYPNLLSNIDAEKDSIEDINTALLLNTELTLLKAKQDAIVSLRQEEFTEQLKRQVEAQTGQNVGTFDYLKSLTLMSVGLGQVADAQDIANQRFKEEDKLSEQRISSLDDINSGLDKEIALLKKKGAIDGKAVAEAKAKADAEAKAKEKADKKAKAKADAKAKAREKEIEQLRQFALEQTQLEDELFKMRMTARELEEQNISEKYDNLMAKAHGNAELEKQLVIQQETELNAIRKEHADKTAQEQADAVKASNALRHSLMRESLTEDMAILQEKFTAEREAVANDMILSEEEKFPLLMEILERENMEEDLIRKKWDDKEVADEKIKQDKKKAIRDANLEQAKNGLNALSSLNNLVTDLQLKKAKGNSAKEEKIRKASFKRNKAMQLGLAVIDGFKAITTSLAQSPIAIGPIPNPAGIASLAFAGITSAVNIAKIASSKYEGGGGGGGGASARPSVPSVGASASSFAISDDTSSAQTELNPDGTVATGSGQNKVVVVETDITNAVNNVAQIEELSTF